MAAQSADPKGAASVMVVDTHKDRLALAEQIGAVAIDDTEAGGVERVMELTGGRAPTAAASAWATSAATCTARKCRT
jgi:threonine dehydrogenase-like Zn-dependent dehydrogenase